MVLTHLSVLVVCSAAVAAEPGPLAPQALEVLRTHCYRCHGQNGSNKGGVNYVTDLRELVARKPVVPGNPASSDLYAAVESGRMPPPDQKPRLTNADVAVLRRWIEVGAPAPDAAPARRTFLSPAAVLEQVRDDLATLPEGDRRFARYFTFAHLYNAGIPGDRLQAHRDALSKLLNSLSWSRKIVGPRAIEPKDTVFRIDLRDYGWDERGWETVLAADPYRVTYGTEAENVGRALSGCKFPLVRADWFVAEASRPPLYHRLLRLPKTEGELERLLGVNVAEDIQSQRVARAGFNGSDVSPNNRLIERHEARYGAYWKAYDFHGGGGRKNLFGRPLGPGPAEVGFQYDLGEILFNLPNGLQAYLIVDDQGKRLNEVTLHDDLVTNGGGCMSCHAHGPLQQDDQVREHVRKNRQAYSAREVKTVLALYPPKEDFVALVKVDRERFARALAQAFGRSGDGEREPIAVLIRQFQSELGLPLAAAEAGLQPDEFLSRLGSTPLARQLPLACDEGTVPRELYTKLFPEIVRRLRVGKDDWSPEQFLRSPERRREPKSPRP